MEFKEYRLGELIEIYNAKRIPLSTAQRNLQMVKKYPYYGAQGIIDYVEDYIFDGKYLLVAEDGENLRSRNTDIALIAEGKFWVNNHAHILQSNSKSNIQVLKFILNKMDLSGYLTGSAQPKLNKQNLEAILIKLPNIHMQNKIGMIIELLEGKVLTNISIIRNLEKLSDSIFKRWFIDFEFQNEQGLPYRSSGGEMVESELGEIPKGWEVGTAGDLFEFSPTVKLSKGTEAPFIEMKNLNTSAMIFEWINRDFTGSGSKFKGGDTILARITPCLENGKIGFVDFLNEDEIGWGSTEFISIRSKGEIDKTFSYFFANSKAFKDYAVANMNGSSGRQRVKAETLAQYAMPILPFELIQQFTNVSSKNMKMMTSLKNEIISLQQLRDTLLPKLLSGEIEI